MLTPKIKKAIVNYKRILKNTTLENFSTSQKSIENLSRNLTEQEQLQVVKIVFSSEL